MFKALKCGRQWIQRWKISRSKCLKGDMTKISFGQLIPGASESIEQTKHWRGQPLFTNNGWLLQGFVSSEASNARPLWYPKFGRGKFVPLSNQYVALVRGPLTPTPPGRYAPACLWTLIDRAGPAEWFIYICCCVCTKAVAIIMLKFMTLGVWHEWDSGKVGGGRKCLQLSQMRLLKSEARDRTLGIKSGASIRKGVDFSDWGGQK